MNANIAPPTAYLHELTPIICITVDGNTHRCAFAFTEFLKIQIKFAIFFNRNPAIEWQSQVLHVYLGVCECKSVLVELLHNEICCTQHCLLPQILLVLWCWNLNVMPAHHVSIYRCMLIETHQWSLSVCLSPLVCLSHLITHLMGDFSLFCATDHN